MTLLLSSALRRTGGSVVKHVLALAELHQLTSSLLILALKATVHKDLLKRLLQKHMPHLRSKNVPCKE